MIARCLLLACLSALSSGDYFKEHLNSKPQNNLKTFIYTRKVSPYHVQYERLQYPAKVPFRRPYSVYTSKPYLVEAPKTVQYVKVPVSQQYHFDKQVLFSYKPLHHTISNLPVYFEHKFPSSLDSKVPLEVKVPVESPVSVSVDKLPVNFRVEKPIVETPSEESLGEYVAVPEDPTSQFELSVKKEPSAFQTFEKELLAEQVKGGSTFSGDSFSSLFPQGKQKLVSIQSELPHGWSSENKVILEPIVVSEDPKKWSNFNVSEWVPRYEISDIKTISANEYNFAKPEKQKFEISEVKIPFEESRITDDISNFQQTQKNSFGTSLPTETATYKKYFPYSLKQKNEYASKQQLESPNTKTFQFYNIQSGKIIKPEALISSVTFKNVDKQQNSGIESSKQWITNQEQKITQNETPQQWVKSQNHYVVKSEPNNKRVKAQEEYSTSSEPSKNWINSQKQYSIKENEQGEKLINTQKQYENKKEQIQKWENSQEQYIIQNEPIQHWVKNQEQYTIQSEPDQTVMKNHEQYTIQSEPDQTVVKNHEQYTIQSEPDQTVVKNHEQYTIQSEPDQTVVKNHEQYTIQSEPDQTVVKNHEQYTIAKGPHHDWMKSQEHYRTQKEPTQQWVNSREHYTVHKESNPYNEQNSHLKSDEQSHVSVAQSSQKFIVSPQFETYVDAASSPQRTRQNQFQQQNKQYQEFSQLHTNGFQPLIPEQSKVPQMQFSQQTETNEQFNQGRIHHPHSQTYQQKQIHSQQRHHQHKHRHYQQSQSSSDHQQPEFQVKRPVSSQMQVYQSQQGPIPQQQTSQSNYEQLYQEPEYHQQPQVHQKTQTVNHEAQESQPQSTYQPHYNPRPPQYHQTIGQKHDYWQKRPQQEVFIKGKHADGPSSLEEYEDRGQIRHQDTELYGQKRRQRNPNKSDTGLADHLIRTTRSTTTTTTTEEPTTTTVLSSTTSLSRRKHRRKHKRRNQDTTTPSSEE